MQYRCKEIRVGKLLVLAIFSLLLTSGAAAEWYNSDWDYRKEITFNQSQINGTHQDFPALINISDNDLKEKAQNEGDDILFTSSNGTYKLGHEIESYNNSTGSLTAHVKVLNMTNQSETSIYMYYGNSEASNQETVSEVWSKNYSGVWHFSKKSGDIDDSTSNDLNGSEEGTITRDTSGKIGNAYKTDKTGSGVVNLGNPHSLNFGSGAGSKFTWSAWIKPVDYTNVNNGYIWLQHERSYFIQRSSNNMDLTSNLNGGQHTWVSQPAAGQWHHLAMVYDSGTLRLYFNGEEENEVSTSIGGNSNEDVEILSTNKFNGWNPDGNADEFRVSDVARNIEWISTEYNNQKNPSLFHSLGSQEKQGSSAKYIHTFKKGTKTPRSFFANNSVATIRTAGSFASSPDLTVIDREGTTHIRSATMVNVSGKFEYNYTLNGSTGWYDVKINGITWENVFYQGETWQDNFTDADGNVFSFRRELNISEPGVSDRWFEPVDKNLDFTFSPDNDSIRVVAWNGSRILETPSQVYNVSKSGEAVSNANVFFLSSLNQTENRTYYVVSSKSEYTKSYTGLNNTNTGLDNKTENSYYRAYFNISLGGLLRTVENKIGTGSSLSGSEPMDFYPQLDVSAGINPETKVARIDSTADINVTEGPLRTEVSVNGGLDGETDYPYSVDCEIYAANPYMICEKNLTTQVSEDWESFYFNGMVFGDSNFDWSSYRNSTDDIVTTSLGSSDNSDITGIDSNMKWITFFDNSTGDGVAEIFLQRNFSTASGSNINLRDNSDNDFYQELLIDGTTSVSSGDYWYSKTARMVYNGLKEQNSVNNNYLQLENPVKISEAEEVTNDNEVVTYSSTGNVSSNDSSSVKVFSYWSDDTFLDYAEINITGNGVDGSDTELYFNDSYNIRDAGDFTDESWVNVTLENSTVNAGEISANITVFDVSGKSNSTLVEFNVSDSTPPEYSNIVNKPNNTADLDPGNQVNITANITEYSNISQAFLYYKNDSASNFSRKLMSRESETDFVHKYKSNFTPGYEDNYTYYISANDNLDQRRNSSRTNLTVEWDYTWNFDPSLNGQTDTFNKNVSIGNLTINNTGDFNQTFEFSTGVFNSRTWVNGTKLPASFEVSGNGSTDFFSVNATTRDSTSTEGLDTFNLTVENSSASPELDFSTFDVTTSTGGPFLFTEITEYNSTVTQGDTGVKLTAETTNKGNESARTVNITFELPNSWTVSSGESLKSPNTLALAIGTTKTFTTEVDIPGDASTGTKTLEAVAKSQETNRSTSVQVTVEKKDSNNDQQESSSSGGGGGGGSSAGGSGGTSLSSNQQEELFQTEETYEIVRGDDQEFALKVENPFKEGELENIRVKVSGFLSQYLSVEPSNIDEIGVNQSKNFSINIEAPRYFSRGEYSLKFNITGINNRSQTYTAGNETYLTKDTQKFKENREVKLIVHEISKEEASEALNQSREAVKELENQGVVNTETKELISEARQALKSGNYQKAQQISQQIQSKRQKAENADQTLQEVENLIDEAEYRGLKASRTSRMVSMASAALERGDYSMAANRAEEAKNLYALETKGEINYLNYTKRNWKKLGLGLVLLIGFSTGCLLRLRLFRIKRKLSKLEEEEETLLGLMKQVQRESFEEGKMSMEEYEEAMMQYEKQLSQNVKNTVRLESRKAHWKNIRKGRERYENERDRIQELMQQTQKKYLEEGEIETRVYKQKMQSFRERLTELEGKLAEIEAQKQIKQKTRVRDKIKNAMPV